MPVPCQRWKNRAATSPGLRVTSRQPVGCPPWWLPLCGWHGGARGRCWEPVVATRCNDGPSLCFSVCRRGRAQLRARVWLRVVAGTALVPAPVLMCALCRVVFWFDFFFFFLLMFSFSFPPSPLPACPPCLYCMRQSVSWWGGWAPPPSPACASYVFWGERAWFGSTHSGLIHTSVTLSPSSVTGEDELGQHSVAPARSSPGAAQPGPARGDVLTELVVSPLGSPGSGTAGSDVPGPLDCIGLSRPGGGLSYPCFSPPSWSRPCWVLADMWWPVVTQSCLLHPPGWSPRGWRWHPPLHHPQVPVLAPCSWDKSGRGTARSLEASKMPPMRWLCQESMA